MDDVVFYVVLKVLDWMAKIKSFDIQLKSEDKKLTIEVSMK